MGLYNQTPQQYFSSAANSYSFEALVNANIEVIGNGVISGLTLGSVSGNQATLSTGYAFVGYVLQLSTADVLTFPSGTWDVYACQQVFASSSGVPTAGTYPASTGIEQMVVTVVNHGSTPAVPGALLATVTSTGSSLTINNAPSGRKTIPVAGGAGTNKLYPAQANFTSQPNGTASSFTLVETPNPPSSLVVYKNGILQDPTVYSLSTDVVTFSSTPLSSDLISASMCY